MKPFADLSILLKIYIFAAAAIVLINLGLMVLDYADLITSRDSIYRLFDLNGEFNVAAGLNASLFIVCTIFILRTAIREDADPLRIALWILLALMFSAFLALTNGCSSMRINPTHGI